MSVYYNENDPKAAAWLRELIFEGQIAWGDVDERSIEDVKPSELVGYAQCHFFAGIGGWSYALRLAGWPDDRAVWTGSCPCQPFSAAGRQRGFEDPRHLWPTWFRLLRECAPTVVFGEQVASLAGLAWFDLVHADMEGSAYAVAAADLCAAGVGAPHIRQRLYWVAVADGGNASAERVQRSGQHGQQPQDGGARGLAHHHLGRFEHPQRDGEAIAPSEEGASWLDTGGQRATAERGGTVGELGDTGISRSGRNAGPVPRAQASAERGVRCEPDIAQPASAASGVADNGLEGRGQVSTDAARRGVGSSAQGVDERPLHRGPWVNTIWIPCRDGKSRPVEPGTFPLAHGIPGRVGLLRGYGNAIVPQVAAAFIEATGLA